MSEVPEEIPNRDHGRTRVSPFFSTGEPWVPPSLSDKFVSAFGSSVLEGFAAGHSPRDVLRELVQNEFDAGGTRLQVIFGSDALRVFGNGRVIDKRGWRRLQMLLGTGRIVGADAAKRGGRPQRKRHWVEKLRASVSLHLR